MPYEPPALSPEQASEFPGDILGAFLLAWLTFQRSSPCTTEKTLFPYFSAPSADDMREYDVLYGPDRELAYKRLMHAFRRCQRTRAFDRYFGPGHTKYYEAETAKGLVLLHEWTQETPSRPGLYTGSFRSIKPEEYDEIWLIVRGLKAMPKDPIGNIFHVPLLSPSKQLWHRHLDMKKSGIWNESTFLSHFAADFLREMLEPEPMAKLRELHQKTKTQAILCACYCTDESICHRSLVRKILESMDGTA